jgi:alpha,alpha-trehalase
MRDHIRGLWPALIREPCLAAANCSSLSLDGRHVIPGGRFRELYYWDSYFTMLGLRADGHAPIIEAMLDDFCTLLERYGRIPNGTRTYYLSRSQPPVFHLMCRLSQSRDKSRLARRLSAMMREHAFWMRFSDKSSLLAHPVGRVVPMPDGSILNRYWDDSDSPRDESYREDVELGCGSARPCADLYRDLRAGAESGWDFSSRWFGETGTLDSIRTTAIVPIDLNCFLFDLERAISVWSWRLGQREQATRYRRLARHRRHALTRYLWDADSGYFADFDWRSGVRRTAPTAAAVTPLFAGMATQEQADRTAAMIDAYLLAPGGLRTTTVESGQQWDFPNGWAPLQWLAVQGLARYGHRTLAQIIAVRWVETVEAEYERSGRMLEKYDIEGIGVGGGGEYPVQDGFGWTNGVTGALMDEYFASGAPAHVSAT